MISGSLLTSWFANCSFAIFAHCALRTQLARLRPVTRPYRSAAAPRRPSVSAQVKAPRNRFGSLSVGIGTSTARSGRCAANAMNDARGGSEGVRGENCGSRGVAVSHTASMQQSISSTYSWK